MHITEVCISNEEQVLRRGSRIPIRSEAARKKLKAHYSDSGGFGIIRQNQITRMP